MKEAVRPEVLLITAVYFERSVPGNESDQTGPHSPLPRLCSRDTLLRIQLPHFDPSSLNVATATIMWQLALGNSAHFQHHGPHPDAKKADRTMSVQQGMVDAVRQRRTATPLVSGVRNATSAVLCEIHRLQQKNKLCCAGNSECPNLRTW